jgi:hypothetical protein
MIANLLTMITLALIAQAGTKGTSEQPRVDPRYRAEVARLAAQGLRLKEAFEVTSEGGQYLAAVFEQPQPKDISESYEFRIIENANGAARTLFRRTEFFFSLPSDGPMAKLNGTDINRDGAAEIIVQASSGGNCWSCNPTEIYTLRGHKAELIAAGPMREIQDLDGDGSVELLVTDARWEFYSDFSHVASPSATIVYSWRNGRYVYASRDYSAYYGGELKDLRARLAEARAMITADDDTSDEGYCGLAVSLAITYVHLGDAGRGIKELEMLLGTGARSVSQRTRRAGVLSDFRNGESSTRIREMKYGDAMPLG